MSEAVSGNLLQVHDLSKVFVSSKGLFGGKGLQVRAVNHVTFDICRGETLGLVGESGCGKSTLGRTILRLIEPTEGYVVFDGINLSELSDEQMRRKRVEMQMVFQDPYSCLNPRMNVTDLVKAPLDVFGIGTQSERMDRVREILDIVGIGEHLLRRYPHEFSGGQRQRIGIARALITRPRFVVCDEPVSALDVSVRASVLNLMDDLQEKMELTYLFISHDLSVVRHISDRIVVMYLGTIVEIAGRDELYANAAHPYTKALLSAIPIPDPEVETSPEILEGEPPSPYNVPSGCPFHNRCRYCTERCRQETPALKDIGGGHMAACHLYST